MALNGSSILLGATAHTPTGGAATTVTVLGSDRQGAKLLINDSAAFNVRSTINATVVEPTVNDTYPGGYTPAKRRMARVKPIVLADGSIFNNQSITEFIVHPETTAAQITELKQTQILLINDSEYNDFWGSGSVS